MQISGFNTGYGNRSSDHTSGNETEGSGSDGNRIGTGNTGFLKKRSEGSGSSVPAYHRNGTGRKTESRIKAERSGDGSSSPILENAHDHRNEQE